MKKRRLTSAAAGLALAAILTVGFAGTRAFTAPSPAAGGKPGATAPSKPQGNTPAPETLPNEMGQIMILEYHLIGRPENDWRRTPENFRADLEMLYRNGYYPIPLQDFLANRMKVPAGKTPVVLTFDDSSAGQFRYLNQNGRLVIDPESAVGIMERFAKEHPGFPARATFFVLPAIEPKLRLFGQPEYIAEKLQFLVKQGYELGSHTYWHQNLGKASREEVRRQLALAEKAVQEFVPGYRLKALALPFGSSPSDKTLLKTGEFEGHRYDINAVLLVGAGPSLAPMHKGFDPMRLPRIQAGDHAFGPAFFVQHFARHPEKRYFSDGKLDTLSVPASETANLSAKLNGITVVKIPAPQTKGPSGE